MVKSTYSILLCFLCFFTLPYAQTMSPCGNKKVMAQPKVYLNCFDKIQFDEEINTYVLAKDGYSPFTGTCQTWNRGGFLIEQITCKNGKRDGRDTSYYASGCIQSVQDYVIGIKNGPQLVFFDSTGQIQKEVNYAMDKLNGASKEFNRSGDTIMFSNYKLDIPDGLQRTYYPSGKCYKIVGYKDGLLNGIHKTFNQEGGPEIFLNYKDGKKQGKCVYYHPNGKESSVSFFEAGLRNGVFTDFNELGTLVMKGEFKKDIRIGEHIENDEKGKLIHQTLFDKKGIRQYEMRVDEYGEKQVIFDINKVKTTSNSSEVKEDDDPTNIKGDKKEEKKRKKRRKKDKKNKNI